MKNWLKEGVIIVSSLAFYILSGDGSSAFLLMVLLNYFEFIHSKKSKREY